MTTGSANINLTPTTAKVNFRILGRAKTAAAAYMNSNMGNTGVLKANLVSISIIETFKPLTTAEEASGVVALHDGFEATRIFVVNTIPSEVSGIVDKIVQAGADSDKSAGSIVVRLDSIVYDVTSAERTDAQMKLLGEAALSSRSKALAITSAINQKLGLATSISAFSQPSAPPMFSFARGDSAPNNFEPGGVELSAEIQFTWVLKD